MATYDYQCTACSSQFEVEKPMDESSRLEICPHCGAEAKQVFKAMHFHLKGMGWTKNAPPTR